MVGWLMFFSNRDASAWQPQPAPAPPKVLGALSCAATACHGSVAADLRPGNIRRNEYVFWFENDPHSRAYDTLDGKLSRIILDRLAIRREGKILDQAAFDNCLACHNPVPPPARRGPNFTIGSGVDCEACHGPAEKWIDSHYVGVGGGGGGNDGGGRPKLPGMVATKDLTTRASLCVDCHVGTATQQVNHDLIAAGHPVLKFEFSSYLDMLPKHWDVQRDKRRVENFEASAWQIGQTASARASLDVLTANVTGAFGVWPEFASYDCYACHHDLAHPSWRQGRGFSGRRPGALPWGSWYFGSIERAAKQSNDMELAASVSALRDVMQGSLVPERSAVVTAADRVSNSLPTGGDASRLRTFLLGLEDKPPSEIVPNWEIAAQVYLAAVAMNQNLIDRHALARVSPSKAIGRLSSAVNGLRMRLAFPQGSSSPSHFRGDVTTVEAPADDAASERAAVFAEIKRIVELLNDISGTTP